MCNNFTHFLFTCYCTVLLFVSIYLRIMCESPKGYYRNGKTGKTTTHRIIQKIKTITHRIIQKNKNNYTPYYTTK